MIKSVNLFFLYITVLVITSCNFFDKEEKTELTISVAASVNTSIEEIVKEYKKVSPKTEIKINSGGSGTLEQQITGGAVVDLVLFASKINMDHLEEKGFLADGTRKDILKNELVLIGNNVIKGKINQVSDLKRHTIKIALGELSTVPAGKYAKQAFEKLGLWTEIEKKIIYQKDVTAVSTIVDMGEIEVGVVYRSDVLLLKNSFIIETFPEDTHDPIVYPVAILKNSEYQVEAMDFMRYLESDRAKAIFKKNGFTF